MRTIETSSGGAAAFTWTGDDSLASWASTISGAARSAAYTYDGDGQRTQATVIAPSPWSTSTTSTAYAFGYDGLSLRWMSASSAGASATLSYLYAGGGTPYAGSYAATTSQGATSTAFHLLSADHGDVVALADATGEVFARYTYGPFGEAEGVVTRATDSGSISSTLAAEIASANPVRYAGYAYDTWSGDYYLSARYYDPATRQFISKDPGVADGEESTYQYCGGDPIQQIDRDGARATYTNEGNTAADAAIYAYSRAKRARRAAMLDRARARMRALIRLRAEQRETRRRIEAAARARARAAMRMREKIRAKAERQALARKAKKAEEKKAEEQNRAKAEAWRRQKNGRALIGAGLALMGAGAGLASVATYGAATSAVAAPSGPPAAAGIFASVAVFGVALGLEKAGQYAIDKGLEMSGVRLKETLDSWPEPASTFLKETM